MQIVNVFLCRSVTRSVFATGVSGNRLILAGIGLEAALLLLVNYTPWINFVLGTAPVADSVWLLIAPFALAMLFLEELRKWMVRKYLPRTSAGRNPQADT